MRWENICTDSAPVSVFLIMAIKSQLHGQDVCSPQSGNCVIVDPPPLGAPTFYGSCANRRRAHIATSAIYMARSTWRSPKPTRPAIYLMHLMRRASAFLVPILVASLVAHSSSRSRSRCRCRPSLSRSPESGAGPLTLSCPFSSSRSLALSPSRPAGQASRPLAGLRAKQTQPPPPPLRFEFHEKVGLGLRARHAWRWASSHFIFHSHTFLCITNLNVSKVQSLR